MGSQRIEKGVAVNGSRAKVAADSAPEIVVDQLSCTFRHRTGGLVRALDRVTFTVSKGEFVAVVGRSGHGKTTLLRVLAGLQRPTRGEVLVEGRPVTGPGVDRGMVFQADSVFPWMNVRDNVEFGLRARGVPREERRVESDRWLGAVDLLGFAGSWPRELSGGMKKRVALAALLAAGSAVWLMDEPFGSLDYFTRRTLQDLVVELWRTTDRTIFFVTHDIEEALILADRILLIADGRLVADLDVGLPRPRTDEVRASSTALELTRKILDQLRLKVTDAQLDSR
jgi:NitT/TauT family transport system ATP-binding protein